MVFATSDASQETMQFAKDLGVELFLKDEFTLVKDAEAGLPVPYGNYGNLMRVILYQYTKDVAGLIPYSFAIFEALQYFFPHTT